MESTMEERGKEDFARSKRLTVGICIGVWLVCSIVSIVAVGFLVAAGGRFVWDSIHSVGNETDCDPSGPAFSRQCFLVSEILSLTAIPITGAGALIHLYTRRSTRTKRPPPEFTAVDYFWTTLIGTGIGYVPCALFALVFWSWYPFAFGVFICEIPIWVARFMWRNAAIGAEGDDETRTESLRFAPPSGKASIYVFRHSSTIFAAGIILVDGEFVAAIKGNSFTCIPVTPGSHTVSVYYNGIASMIGGPASDVKLGEGEVVLLRQVSQDKLLIDDTSETRDALGGLTFILPNATDAIAADVLDGATEVTQMADTNEETAALL